MYENENLQNNQNPQNLQNPQNQQAVVQVVKEKKPGFFARLMLSVSLGLFFGIFAGVGFVAVQQGSALLPKQEVMEEEPEQRENVREKKRKEEQPAEEKEEPEKPEDPEEVIKPANTQVHYTNSSFDVSAIVDDVMPAMVSILNNYTGKSTYWGQRYEEEMESSGSGIIVSQNETELLIVTNHHVVKDANELTVTFIDGSEAEARIKGTDADEDLAVIAIPLKELKKETQKAIAVVPLGDSDELRLGEQVIAIGNALGYGQSVTVGYVSALNREIEVEDNVFRTFIQTDAAINPGNSGGALLNAKGEVIGINSAKIGGEAIEGMGYAIPITSASPIIAELMERQIRYKVSEADRGYIGISMQDVTEDIARMYGIPKGVYVLSVQEDSAAERAGMVKGDVIVKFDGIKLTCMADLQDALQYCAAGDEVELVIMRPQNGEYVEHELVLILGEKPPKN